MVCILSIVLGPSGRITHVIRYIAYIGLFGTGKCRFIQVLYLGRAPRTKETLPDFREKCRVTRHSRVFRGLTGSQRTLGFLGRHRFSRERVSSFSLDYRAIRPSVVFGTRGRTALHGEGFAWVPDLGVSSNSKR